MIEKKLDQIDKNVKAIAPTESSRGIPLNYEHRLQVLEEDVGLGSHTVLDCLRRLDLIEYVYDKKRRMRGHRVTAKNSRLGWFVDHSYTKNIDGFDRDYHFVKITEQGMHHVPELVKETNRIMKHEEMIEKKIENAKAGREVQKSIPFEPNSDLDKIKGSEDLYTNGPALPS